MILAKLSQEFGLAIERWRVQWGGACEDWLVAAGEFEALASLAGYAYENPDAVYWTGCPSVDLAAEMLQAPALGFDPVAQYGGVGDVIRSRVRRHRSGSI